MFEGLDRDVEYAWRPEPSGLDRLEGVFQEFTNPVLKYSLTDDPGPDRVQEFKSSEEAFKDVREALSSYEGDISAVYWSDRDKDVLGIRAGEDYVTITEEYPSEAETSLSIFGASWC
ncbi:MAG: hypothetical protein ABEJ93_03440 [Candidatus Nanohalobium sp.]